MYEGGQNQKWVAKNKNNLIELWREKIESDNCIKSEQYEGNDNIALHEIL